ncbi:MAG: hypothetical protein GYA46_04345 [candidate division Zixibacteria bacterium]|nr:hypothetical protein [candidate division Zixibacteria bacterium]
MMRAMSIYIVLFMVLCGPWALAQTTLNPDLSLVGDFRMFSHDDSTRADEKERFNLASPEMELMVGGYLNPYARADAVIAWEGEETAEIEELYATILRGLPLGTNLRVGKYLLEFGRLNPVHPHAWSFLQRPLPQASFFGDHGLNDMAVRASFILPTGAAYTELMMAVTKGDALLGHHHDEEAAAEKHAEDDEERVNPGFFGRMTTSFAVADASELALGASLVNSVYEREEAEEEGLADRQLRATIIGGDIKYKYRPSRYTAVQIEAEGLVRSEEQSDDNTITSCGGYGYVDYRFRQRYNIGGIYEYLAQKELMEGEESPVETTHTSWRAGVFIGFAPVEETSLLRLTGHWTREEGRDGYWEGILQLVISLGSHQPHNF